MYSTPTRVYIELEDKIDILSVCKNTKRIAVRKCTDYAKSSLVFVQFRCDVDTLPPSPMSLLSEIM